MTQVKIQGEIFEINPKYSAGHQLTEIEASVLNQTYFENIRNNVAGKIKAAKEAAEKAGQTFSLDTAIAEGEDSGRTLRQVLTEYATGYEFGVRSTRTSEPVDPVEREARALAREAISAAFKDKGIKRKDVPDETYEALLAKHAATEKIVALAKKRVKEREALASGELDLSSLEQATA